MEYRDKEFEELSSIFVTNEDNTNFKGEFLNNKLLDFSLESLVSIDEYLNKIKHSSELSEEWNKVVLRCGVYIGEVIRKNSGNNVFHWLYYEDTKQIQNEIMNSLDECIGTSAILFRKENFFCFPLAKVEKILEHGEDHSVTAFVKGILERA